MNDLVICDKFSYSRVIELCQEKGFGIEIQSLYDSDPISDKRIPADLRWEALREISLRSMRGPHGDLFPGTFNRYARHTAGERYGKAVATAEILNIDHIVLYHGYVPGASPTNGWLNQYRAFWNEFLSCAPDSIHFHLENILEKDPVLISEAVAAINHPRVDVCLNVGHAHCYSSTDVIDWIKHLTSQIGYVHLHDNHGERDEHLALGRGTIPMVEVCHALRECSPDAIWALEVEFSAVEPSLEWLVKTGFL